MLAIIKQNIKTILLNNVQFKHLFTMVSPASSVQMKERFTTPHHLSAPHVLIRLSSTVSTKTVRCLNLNSMSQGKLVT